MTFWDIATSKLLWILVGGGLLYVFVLSGIVMVKGWKRSIELGVDPAAMKKVVASSLTFSVLPSLSIVIGLISLSAVLGTPWSWFRLSVVGSVSYELMAAQMAGSSLGFDELALIKDQPAHVMGAVMLVMSIGILAGNVFNLFFAKSISTSISSYNAKSGGWGALFSNCFMVTLVTVMCVVQGLTSTIHLLTLISSFVIATILGVLAKKLNWKWMGEYVLVLTLLLGMVSAVMWSGVIH